MRIDVAGGLFTICFLKRSVSGVFGDSVVVFMTVMSKEWRSGRCYRYILVDTSGELRASGSADGC